MQRPVGIAAVVQERDTSVSGLHRARHIDLQRVTSALCRRPAG